MHKVFLLLCWGLCGSQLLPAQAIPLSNSDFATGTDGWSAFGNALLTHVPAGALSAGAARLEVTQSGGYSSAGLQTSVLAVPSSARGAMHLLTVQVRGGGPAQQTFRIRAYLTNSAGQTTETNMDEWPLSTGFQDMAAPVYIAADVVSVQLRFQCGLQSGLYFFDDVYLMPVHTPAQSIAQFDHWAPRQFVRPQAVMPQSLSSAAANAQVVIGSDERRAEVLPTQFGVNSNFRSGNGLVGRAAAYRPFGSFRFPAGSGSNQYFWDCEAPPSFAIPVNDFCG
ncbi:MAG TPA: hypothetical protein PLL53_03765, partial [Saprospiraceae bacterium]|nr:hypothetical protein [Saprospiraceae bacterium]